MFPFKVYIVNCMLRLTFIMRPTLIANERTAGTVGTSIKFDTRRVNGTEMASDCAGREGTGTVMNLEGALMGLTVRPHVGL
jgi:hypothetical protein